MLSTSIFLTQSNIDIQYETLKKLAKARFEDAKDLYENNEIFGRKKDISILVSAIHLWIECSGSSPKSSQE